MPARTPVKWPANDNCGSTADELKIDSKTAIIIFGLVCFPERIIHVKIPYKIPENPMLQLRLTKFRLICSIPVCKKTNMRIKSEY